MHEVRLALIALATQATASPRVPLDRRPWWINEDAGTVRDNDGALIAYIDPTALHLVEQLAQMGVA